MAAVRLTPEAFVEVDEMVLGGRKMGIVDATGLGYFDLHGSMQLPKVLNEELHPVELGSIGSWLAELEAQQRDQLIAVWQYMLNENYDLLTVARAIRWGLANDVTDLALLIEQGKQATAVVRKAVNTMEAAARV